MPTESEHPAKAADPPPGGGSRAREAEEYAFDWCRRHGLLRGRTPAESFRRARFGALAARTHPQAPPGQLALLAAWVAWGFVLDDLLDRRDARTADPLLADLVAVTAGKRRSRNAFVRAYEDLWRRTTETMDPPVRERFRANLTRYLNVLGEESAQRSARRVPSLEAYLPMRLATGGVREDLDIADHLAGRSLPEALYTHPWHQRILDTASDVVNWTNDLASYPKEAAAGEVHNLVIVLAHADGVDHGRAAESVRTGIAARTEEFTALAAAGPPHPELAARVADLGHWITGFRGWLSETGRYRV
ncbi:hypothetical protein GCM10010232_33210 [Streptomyces amakusaensis]|uniref:Terpene synthase n=1 Tax=Streptomyces amakusaensis TaxID=67271 RepID=A0ABW0AEN8_9ACTN